jgi:cell division transport system ATP-binding protein
MIRFENVSKSFPGGYGGLHHVNLNINPGEMIFVTGHSGAGKTTLFKLIAMIERPTHGAVYLNQSDVSHLHPARISEVRRQMGLIFQNPYLLMHRTVIDNVALPLLIDGFRVEEAYKRASAALDKVGLHAQRDVLPMALSTGEQQRVGIARAVVNRPAIILADEPTGNVDPDLSLEMMRVFEAFNAIGVTVLIATHDLQLATQLGHRMVVLEKGKVVSDGY